MTVLNTNTAAITAQYNLKKVQSEMDDAMTALSSGKRINTASDDAAGIAIASRMTATINGFEQAIRNASDAQSMIDTAEGAHDEVANMLQRMRELAVQSGNDSNSATDREALQLEIDQLLTEIDRVSERTIWGGKTLMGGAEGGPTTLNFQVGATSAAGDQIAITIDDTSAGALGLGHRGEAVGNRTTAGISYDSDTGVLSLVGEPKGGDVITFDLADTEVSVTVSEINQYPNNKAGVAAQIKAKVDEVINANANVETLRGISVTDNGDGTLSFTQSAKTTIDTYTNTAQEATISEENGTITFTGTYAGEALTVNINGVTVSWDTSTASDGFEDSLVGTASKFAQAVHTTAGLENVLVTDHNDGSVTITQKTTPLIDGAEIAATNKANVTFEYDDTDKITVDGAWTAGQQVSMDIFGETVSFTVADDDAFDNTLAGITEQLAAAINSAGIVGLSAAKDTGANTVTLTADVLVGNGKRNAGSDTLVLTSIGNVASGEVRLHDSDVLVGNITADVTAYTAGKAFSFEVMGQEVAFVVGTDGYTNDKEGVSQQMKDLVDALDIAGLDVATASTTTAGITITRKLDNTNNANTGSNVVTNIQSLAADEVVAPKLAGSISVATAEGASDAIDRIDAAMVTLQEQRATLGSVSNRLDHTITNLSNVNVNLQASRSRIEDADFATQTSNLTKAQILSQAATAMLAQANASKQSVLSLLQG